MSHYMNLLQENGDCLLQENGDNILLEQYWYDFSIGVGSFSLTGFSIAFTIGRGIFIEVGSFILTGYGIVFSSFRSIYPSVGNFILTGYDAIIKLGKSFREKPRVIDFQVNSIPLTSRVDDRVIQNSSININKPQNLK